jgi:hypothetical protein
MCWKHVILVLKSVEEHVQDHIKDAKFLNTSLVNYEHMEACFTDKLATGKFAMGSNEPLGKPIDVECLEKTIDLESGEINEEGFVKAQTAFSIGGQGMDSITPSPSSGPNEEGFVEDSIQVSNMYDALLGVVGAI